MSEHARECSERRLDDSGKNDVTVVCSSRRHCLNQTRKHPVKVRVKVFTKVACKMDDEVEKRRRCESVGLCQWLQQQVDDLGLTRVEAVDV